MSDKCFKRVLSRNCQRVSFCDEVTQLEAQFRNAYTMKALEAQLAEKHADKLAEQIQEKLSMQSINIERENFIEREKNKKIETLKNREKYKKILEEQIISKELARKKEIEAAIVERKVLEEVDELMDKLHELAKQKRRDFYVKKMRHERLLFEEIRAIKRAINEEKELKAIERETLYLEEIERRSREMNIQRENQVKRREALIEEVAKLYVDVTIERREREAIINDLAREEIMHEAMIEEHEEKYKKLKAKEELNADLKRQMLLSIECESRAKERDRLFAEEVMRKVMNDMRLVQLTVEARKRKQIHYKEELEKLIADRMRIRNETLTRRIEEELNENQMNEQMLRQRINEDRRKLIVHHAGNVIGYLRDGILTHDEQNIVKELLEKCKIIENKS
ncbi:hypothetical protein PV326_003980 [Microctonus aethiopoides]|uniref:Meiosis-specific nuclear structural protein 1 n=1 Tax=Microctonus aethiopoides TaxID=144406 RepID=A0AA39CAH4_9HYME|nr:hypothetical protein PV326_003980 [Microctonus aethiopoides]KAK0160445.1 hypothetical protein PV328_007855 [Microctonus aethiopoides]